VHLLRRKMDGNIERFPRQRGIGFHCFFGHSFLSAIYR
jgi:hypothetical protein